MNAKATATRNSKEAIITIRETDLVDLIPRWNQVAPNASLVTGPSVDEAMEHARSLRKNLASAADELDFHNQHSVADFLYAACRSLMEDCQQDSRRVLVESSSIHGLLDRTVWETDTFEEKQSLLSSLAFVAWRAARSLDRSKDVNKWEAEYRRVFRSSLTRQIVNESFDRASSPELAAKRVLSEDPERVFQELLFLQDHGETDPVRVLAHARMLYEGLETKRWRVAADLRLHFRGEAAKLAGAMLRSVGEPREVEEWLDRAATEFHAGVNPRPGLARVMFQRMALYHVSGRFDVVTRTCPQLDVEFESLGMLEDRVKNRILWACSLKLMGLLPNALEVLKPVREMRTHIWPVLYGWVLLQSGDVQQLIGNEAQALEELAEAARLLKAGKHYVGLADLTSMISTIYRSKGRLEEAVALLQASRVDHARLGMKWPEAYLRVLIAETYLAMGRPREAESEIRAALPILEEQGMLADAVIAVNLLREAVRQGKLLPIDARDAFKPKT